MASNLKLSTAGRNAAVEAIGALLDGGRIEHRVGIPPTNVNDASTGTLLGTNTFAVTAFGSPSTGTITAATIADDTSADASGDAGYFRCYASGGSDTQAILQGTSGEAADSPDLVFDEKTIVAGGTISITSLTLTIPIQ